MSDSAPLRVNPDEKPDDFQAMVVGASVVFAFATLAFLIQFGCICLPEILGSLLAVYWYTKKHKITISAGKGITLGIMTCLFGGIAAFVFTMVLQKLGIHPLEETIAKIVAGLEQARQSGGNQEIFDKITEFLESDSAHIVMIVSSLIMILIGSVVGGMIGGAIGAAVFKKAPPESPVV